MVGQAENQVTATGVQEGWQKKIIEYKFDFVYLFTFDCFQAPCTKSQQEETLLEYAARF